MTNQYQTEQELMALRRERTRLINRLEFGRFTQPHEAQAAQERLNRVNVLIDNNIQEHRKNA